MDIKIKSIVNEEDPITKVVRYSVDGNTHTVYMAPNGDVNEKVKEDIKRREDAKSKYV